MYAVWETKVNQRYSVPLPLSSPNTSFTCGQRNANASCQIYSQEVLLRVTHELALPETPGSPRMWGFQYRKPQDNMTTTHDTPLASEPVSTVGT